MATKVTMTYVIDGIPPAHDRDLIRAIKDMLGGSEWGRQALDWCWHEVDETEED